MKAGINRRQFMQKSLVGRGRGPARDPRAGPRGGGLHAGRVAQRPDPGRASSAWARACLQGSGLLDAAVAVPGVEVIGVCDAYKGRVTRALQNLGGKAKDYGDYRALLADKSIDAVVIATPDHWHKRDDPRGARRGQGRLPREADDPHHRRGPRDVRGGREVGPRPPDRQPGHQLEAAGDGARDRQVRQARPDHPRPRELRPQLRLRRLALPHPPRRRPEDGRTGTCSWARRRSGRSASSASSAGALLGLLGRHLDRPLRPPDDDHPLRDGRDRPRDGGGDGGQLPAPEDARGPGHAQRLRRLRQGELQRVARRHLQQRLRRARAASPSSATRARSSSAATG